MGIRVELTSFSVPRRSSMGAASSTAGIASTASDLGGVNGLVLMENLYLDLKHLKLRFSIVFSMIFHVFKPCLFP